MISDKFIFLGVALNLVGMSNYVYYTLTGRVKPNRVTFFMWALAGFTAFGAELGKGVGLVALMTFMVSLGPLATFIASFVNKKAYWQLSGFDFACGGLSVLGLLLWAVTREGNLALLFSILGDCAASTPTVIKAYKVPHTESYGAYSLSAISAVITLLTIDKWTFANWGFPVYIFLICSVFTYLIGYRPRGRIGV